MWCSTGRPSPETKGLNEVRPRRPEQFEEYDTDFEAVALVSMKSGLEGRNNHHATGRLGRGM